jgi:hypothetical protein
MCRGGGFQSSRRTRRGARGRLWWRGLVRGVDGWCGVTGGVQCQYCAGVEPEQMQGAIQAARTCCTQDLESAVHQAAGQLQLCGEGIPWCRHLGSLPVVAPPPPPVHAGGPPRLKPRPLDRPSSALLLLLLLLRAAGGRAAGRCCGLRGCCSRCGSAQAARAAAARCESGGAAPVALQCCQPRSVRTERYHDCLYAGLELLHAPFASCTL